MTTTMILSAHKEAPERRFRLAPKVWQKIIGDIYNSDYDGSPFTYDQLLDLARKYSHQITRESLRVKIARYKKSGYIKSSRKRGAFWVTIKGQYFFGLKERNRLTQVPKNDDTAMSSSMGGKEP